MASRPGWVAEGLKLGDLKFWSVGVDVATWVAAREVATRKWRRDLVCFGWVETALRHEFDVATWAAVWEVVT